MPNQEIAVKSIHLDMHTAFTNSFQLAILQQVIEQHHAQCIAANKETVRLPCLNSDRAKGSKVWKIYNITDAQGNTQEITLSHSISGELNKSDGKQDRFFSRGRGTL